MCINLVLCLPEVKIKTNTQKGLFNSLYSKCQAQARAHNFLSVCAVNEGRSSLTRGPIPVGLFGTFDMSEAKLTFLANAPLLLDSLALRWPSSAFSATAQRLPWLALSSPPQTPLLASGWHLSASHLDKHSLPTGFSNSCLSSSTPETGARLSFPIQF